MEADKLSNTEDGSENSTGRTLSTHMVTTTVVIVIMGAIALTSSIINNRPTRLRGLPHPDSALHNNDDSLEHVNKSGNCLGPPYLYVTVHDDVPNVLKYSRNGCLLDRNVLLMDEAYDTLDDVSFRSLAVGKHDNQEVLFIADANKDNSRLLIFDKCIDGSESMVLKGKRHFVEIVADHYHNPGLDHSYGVCHDSYGNVYVSNQHTNSVLRYYVGNFTAMPLPPAIQLDGRLNYYEGTFVQFGLPGHSTGEHSVRAIAHAKNKIWIAHEELSGVAIADVDTGFIDTFISLDSPIGLYHLAEMNLMFVSCKSKSRGGIVYAVDLINHTIQYSYATKKMEHPTGLASYGGILYVAEQSMGAILAFDIVTEQYLGKIVNEPEHSGQIEQMTLSPC